MLTVALCCLTTAILLLAFSVLLFHSPTAAERHAFLASLTVLGVLLLALSLCLLISVLS